MRLLQRPGLLRASPRPMSSFSALPWHPLLPHFLLLLRYPSSVLALLFLQSKQDCWKNNLQEAGGALSPAA